MLNEKLSLLLFILNLYIVSADYDSNKALTCAYASALSHCNPPDIQTWTCGAACTNLTGFKNYFSTVVNVTVDQSVAFTMILNPSTKTFITSFRGTTGPIQLILEILEYKAMPYKLENLPGAFIENYFYSHYVNNLRELLIRHLKTAVQTYPDYEFIFTGHSLGGAFATLAAYDSVTSNLTVKNQTILYNYGSPRVGNHVFGQALENAVRETYRVTHWKDLVPHVPPCVTDKAGHCVKNTSMFIDLDGLKKWPMYHISQEVFYDEASESYVLCSLDEEDPMCMNQFKEKDWQIKDHRYYLNVHIECDPNPSKFIVGNFLEKDFDQILF